jgi:predicted transcriptional regulator
MTAGNKETARPRNAAMPISQYDIDSFHSFATGELTNDNRNQSMEDLVERWRSQREEKETLASIQRGIEDADAGRVNSLDEVDANIRQKLGFPARSK